MSTGHGDHLGGALQALFYDAGGTGAKASYRAVGWHAQVRKLSELGARGSAAADQVGLDVTERTLKAWLSEGRTPSASNQARIHEAYRALARGQFPTHLKTAVFSITGEVTITNRKGITDVRHRGRGGQAPLRIEGRFGRWEPIEEGWESGDQDTSTLEHRFIWDVIMNDPNFDGISGKISFPGSDYTVSA